MASRIHKELKYLVHPYIFVLKEGKKIGDDFLDYSLLILQVGRAETLKSPANMDFLADFEASNLSQGLSEQELF